MMVLHHGKWRSGFETKRKVCFCDFWHIHDDFALKMLQTPVPKLKTHPPTNVYMIYPMVQSVLLVCVEKVKKMAPQRGIVHHGHHPSSKIKIILARGPAPTKI
jgi:hypothetical protein